MLLASVLPQECWGKAIEGLVAARSHGEEELQTNSEAESTQSAAAEEASHGGGGRPETCRSGQRVYFDVAGECPEVDPLACADSASDGAPLYTYCEKESKRACCCERVLPESSFFSRDWFGGRDAQGCDAPVDDDTTAAKDEMAYISEYIKVQPKDLQKRLRRLKDAGALEMETMNFYVNLGEDLQATVLESMQSHTRVTPDQFMHLMIRKMKEYWAPKIARSEEKLQLAIAEAKRVQKKAQEVQDRISALLHEAAQ